MLALAAMPRSDNFSTRVRGRLPASWSESRKLLEFREKRVSGKGSGSARLYSSSRDRGGARLARAETPERQRRRANHKADGAGTEPSGSGDIGEACRNERQHVNRRRIFCPLLE